jgi:hypothetical protein
MSRTYHHREYYKRSPESAWDYGTEKVLYISEWVDPTTKEVRKFTTCQIVDLRGAKKKQKRNGFHPKHWARATPSWWIREWMTVPKRAKCRNWEKTRHLDNLDEDCPDYGRKPHVYYC